MVHTILGIVMTITGIFDGIKYLWEGQAIIKVKTSKGHSRKFINVAIVNDIVRILYLVTCPVLDWYLLISALVAIICMIFMYVQVYWYYPYIGKRANIFSYIWNSLLPNNIRPQL